mgnify:CR=1 FL=1
MEYEISSTQNKLTLPPESLFLSNQELKKRIKKEEHEYINQAVIDIDSWYRDIEKLELNQRIQI